MDYTQALEKRLQWLRWSHNEAKEIYDSRSTSLDLEMYQWMLAHGDTFLMNKRFCELVDYARRTIPDNLEFDPAWMVSKAGWMWLESPAEMPRLDLDLMDKELAEFMKSEHASKYKDIPLHISAIGWQVWPEESIGHGMVDGPVSRGIKYSRSLVNEQILKPGAVEFACFQDLERMGQKPGFGMWSFFVLQPGQKVLERIHQFETLSRDTIAEFGGSYKDSREADMLHEIRWAYTAMHLMSEKLATQVEHKAERGTRRRFERERVPFMPFLRIVTLRRMEEARKNSGVSHEVDWQWQWHVDGHWRNQWYPAEQAHKTKWIEEYIKGPVDKPLKPPVHTIYNVKR